MLVSLEWLSEYVEHGLGPEELADALSMSGTAVDRVITAGKGVEGVFVGRVVEVREHPDADNLRLAMVEDGSVVREVVCGAPNLEAGMKSAIALPGARLPAASDRELKRAVIRGVESDGMLVSTKELGLTDDATGIIELGRELQTGLDIHEVLPLDDVILDLEITPNRPDCMSMMGVAREVSVLTGATLRRPQADPIESGGLIDDVARVQIKDPQGCPRYTARAVTGVRVAASPPWMQRRLMAAGLRPINNIVDVTNYVLVEMGQPLHAFDLELVGEKTIIVRLARQGEVITTLDGADRQLDDRSLVIADISEPVAIAGIMGGEGSEVSESTVNVLIESAHFSPTSIFLTSRRLGLRTEASARFERGTDPEGTVVAARRAARLINELGGGSVCAGEIDENPVRYIPVGIELRHSRIRDVVGVDLTPDEAVRILEGLECAAATGKDYLVTVPPFRPDLTREIDLIEEIARVYGYDRIDEELPPGGGEAAGLTARQRLQDALAAALVARGAVETWTYSFVSESDIATLEPPDGSPLSRTVRLANPLAETGEVLRTTLVPGLVNAALFNVNRGNRDLKLFEKARVFHSRGPDVLPDEEVHLGVLLTGSAQTADWTTQQRAADFFDLKGLFESAVVSLGVEDVAFEAVDLGFLAPGRSAKVSIAGAEAGFAGQLHPGVAGRFGLEQEVFVLEARLEPLLDAAMTAGEKPYRPVGRYPNVKVDIALTVSEDVPAGEVRAEVERLGGGLLTSVRLFDVYRGVQVGEGRKSLAFALEFTSAERTLTDDEIHSLVADVVMGLELSLGAELRGDLGISGGDI